VIMLSLNTSPNDQSRVMALSDFRRIALSMPGTEETNGMGYPNFRTGRKSFAAIEDSMAVIRLTRDQQATFVAPRPDPCVGIGGLPRATVCPGTIRTIIPSFRMASGTPCGVVA
jgi:hypothetical protein